MVKDIVDFLDAQRGSLDDAVKRELSFDIERFEGDLIALAQALPNEASSIVKIRD